ncbi:hypothetical protein SDC9_88855 [bioreactor metagenome]|uniref:Uncharacterized protein n=1 Tax=bioreactor metagenome TaxID=1076179 RepID=A0A644ZMY4_9ZZZZ
MNEKTKKTPIGVFCFGGERGIRIIHTIKRRTIAINTVDKRLDFIEAYNITVRTSGQENTVRQGELAIVCTI